MNDTTTPNTVPPTLPPVRIMATEDAAKAAQILPAEAGTPPVIDDRPIRGWGAMLEALLKNPDRLLRGLVGADAGYLTRHLVVMAMAGMAAYGVVVGLFPGGMQLAAVPLKLAGGLLASALICWPSLYIMLCLSGGRQTAGEMTGVFASALALMVVLMAGFAPVAWIFTQSTHSAGFMGGMHLVLWGVSCVFALRRLQGGLTELNGRPMHAIPVWIVIFVVVCLQMTATLRPLMGTFDGWQFAPREFFLTTWVD